MDVNEIKSFDYNIERGNFNILITKLGIWERISRQNIIVKIVKFSIKVENLTNPDWKTNFFHTFGSMKKIEDEEKLIEKLKDEIKFRIDKDEPGDFCIEEITLD